MTVGVSTSPVTKFVTAKEMQDRIREVIHNKWMTGLRYIDLLSIRKESPLSFAERLVYSFVVWLQRQQPGQSKPMIEIADRLGIGEEQVSRAAKSLEERGLLLSRTGRSNSRLLLPSSAVAPPYFVATNNGSLATTRLYLLSDDAVLKSRDAAVLATLHGLAIARGSLIVENPYAGLAKLSSVSNSQVKHCLKSLREQGLLTSSKGFKPAAALQPPPPIALRNFVGVGVSPETMVTLPMRFEGNQKYPKQFYSVIQLHIDIWQTKQSHDKWTDDQIIAFWRDLVFCEGVGELPMNAWRPLIEEFLTERFPAIWLNASDQHKETGKANNCRFLLKSMATDGLQRLAKERGLL